MLRNRSRVVTSKQAAIMADHSSHLSPTQNRTTPISSFFGSPRFFNGISAQTPSDAETLISPTLILDGKNFVIFGNPFGYDKNPSDPRNTPTPSPSGNKKLDPKGIGLALIDSLGDGKPDDNSLKPDTRMVLFGSKLRIQIPPLPLSTLSPAESPKSPADFGIKTRNSPYLGSLSAFGSVNSGVQTNESPPASAGGLSLSEMELSEDYTCVISHGPNPRTTHIYDDCIVKSCCGVSGLSELKKEYGFSSDNSKSPSVNFLSFCYNCKKNLGEDRDIYMYRGEKAFCSHECRYQEMLSDGVDKSEVDVAFST